MLQPEIDAHEEQEALLEVASGFTYPERGALLNKLAGEGEGNELRSRKVLYRRAVLSLQEKGLVEFFSATENYFLNTLLNVRGDAPKQYVKPTKLGQGLAEELAEQNVRLAKTTASPTQALSRLGDKSSLRDP